jgi:hypothetical protein
MTSRIGATVVIAKPCYQKAFSRQNATLFKSLRDTAEIATVIDAHRALSERQKDTSKLNAR